MVDYKALGHRICVRRKAQNKSQQDVASAIKISVTFYGNIERGTRIPSIDTLVAIANELNVSIDSLLAADLNSAELYRSPEKVRTVAKFLRDQVAELNFEDM